MRARSDERWRLLREIVQPAMTVPENASAHDVLVQMRDRQQQMAIVIDEFGQVVGLITAEDLLEELVGEVFDESDIRRVMVKKLQDGSLLVNAGISLRDLSFSLGSEFALSSDYETRADTRPARGHSPQRHAYSGERLGYRSNEHAQSAYQAGADAEGSEVIQRNLERPRSINPHSESEQI